MSTHGGGGGGGHGHGGGGHGGHRGGGGFRRGGYGPGWGYGPYYGGPVVFYDDLLDDDLGTEGASAMDPNHAAHVELNGRPARRRRRRWGAFGADPQAAQAMAMLGLLRRAAAGPIDVSHVRAVATQAITDAHAQEILKQVTEATPAQRADAVKVLQAQVAKVLTPPAPKPPPAPPSKVPTVLGALSGAGVGALVGGPIGAAVGLAAGWFTGSKIAKPKAQPEAAK